MEDKRVLGKEPAFADTTAAAAAERRRTPLLLVLASVSLFAVISLGLAFGAGLGWGLDAVRHTVAGEATAKPLPPYRPPPSPLPNAPEDGIRRLEHWQLDTDKEYQLDMGWDLKAEPTTRYYDLVITRGKGWPDGVVRDMVYINGKFPGPLIEVNRGDRLVVNVTNTMEGSNFTTMHWHGLFQNGTNWYDGTAGITQCPIPAGKSMVYNFTIENQFGTYWYHSHYGAQYIDGVVGPLIIHAPEEADARKLYDDDRILLMQDWYHDPSEVELGRYLIPENENTEPIPDSGLMNGAGYFDCSKYSEQDGYTCYENSSYTVLSLNKNTRTRLRLINAGAFAEFDFSVDNHELSVIEADGTLVKPSTVHRVPIHVAQRYSVVVHSDQSDLTNYWIRAAMGTFCFTGSNRVLDANTKAVISYSGNNTNAPDRTSLDWGDGTLLQCVDLDDNLLVPSIVSPPPPATTLWRMDFAWGIGAYQLSHAAFNGTIWSPLKETTTLQQAIDGLQSSEANSWAVDDRVGPFDGSQFVLGVGNEGPEVVDLMVYSLDEGSHPFHLHGHDFWIVMRGSGPFDWGHYYENIMPGGDALANKLRRDTFTLQSYSWAVIRFRADNPGLWAFHCHVAWHMEAGLMMQFMSRADLLKDMKVPDDVRALCPA